MFYFFRNGDRKTSTQSTGSGSSDHGSQEGSPLLSPEQRDRKGMNILVQPSLVPFTIRQEKDLILNILNKEQTKYKTRDLVNLVFSDSSPQEVYPRFLLKVNVKDSIHIAIISLYTEWVISGRKTSL